MESDYEKRLKTDHPVNNQVSNCCGSAMIPPDWDMAEEMGSLWRAYACYICKACGKACEPKEDEISKENKEVDTQKAMDRANPDTYGENPF